EEFGAIQYELPAAPEFPGEHFTVVAARGGDDLWVEIRRRRAPDDDSVPAEFFAPPSAQPEPAPVEVERPAAHPVSPSVPSLQIDVDEDAVVGSIDDLPLVQSRSSEAVRDAIEEPVDAAVDVDDDLALPDAAQLWPPRARRAVAEQETAGTDQGFV